MNCVDVEIKYNKSEEGITQNIDSEANIYFHEAC